MKRSKTADDFYQGAELWKTELATLRAIVLKTCLVETLKWGIPCYTCDGKNLVGISGFKSYFGLWFYQGALLKDPAHVLINAQEGTTRAMRQWRMSGAKDIDAKVIRAYIKEVIANQQAGKEIKPRIDKPLLIPPELKAALQKNPQASANFETFTKSKKREYAEHIADAKRAETKLARLEKILPMIEAGVGLNDKYRR